MPKGSLNKVDKLLPYVSTLPIFESLPGEHRSIAGRSEVTLTQPRTKIFSEGDPPDGGFLVASGAVMLTKRTFKGRDVAIELLGPGDPLGMVCAAQEQPYPLTAEVVKESLIYKLDQELLVELTRKVPAFKCSLLQICSERARNSHSMIARLADANSKIRIAGALLLYANKFAKRLEERERVEVSRQELSALAATTVETCIRVTRSLENHGVLAFPRLKCIDILDRGFLEQLCE